MQKELKAEGKDIAFTIVNTTSALTDQKNFTDVVAFPMFQDTLDVNAWSQMGGAKDDIYVYGTDGKLAWFLPFGGKVSTILTDSTDYANVKAIIRSIK